MTRRVLPLFCLLWLVPLFAWGQTTYVVQPGDVLGGIAAEHGVSVEQLCDWNDVDPDTIYAGQELAIHGGSRRQSSTMIEYVVVAGDTAGGIAARHDVSIADLVSWNAGLDPDRIRIGQTIRIRSFGRQTRQVVYEVQPGDFLGRIAERHDVSMSQLQSWNPGLDPDTLQIGQELVMHIEGPEEASVSVGTANGGQLVNGEQLPPHRAYTVRNYDLAWGTNETISAILDAFEHMEDTYSNLPTVEVHDLSREEGGYLSGHRSHQSGRDADIGYYHHGCDDHCEYINLDGDDLDVERTWALFRYWINNDDIEYIFMDYSLQRPLYEYVDEVRGATDAQLREWFQYPRGRGSASGIIRHEPNHADHMHVRFSCPPDDDGCR